MAELALDRDSRKAALARFLHRPKADQEAEVEEEQGLAAQAPAKRI